MTSRRFLLARHAETVFNANARMQGQMAHTPLTRTGIAQAEAMGSFFAAHLGRKPDLDLWASPAGRTLQTAAIVAEHLDVDYFTIRTDPRLLEIDVGDWQGRRYADIAAEQGPILCGERRLFTVVPPNGETYLAVAERLERWLADIAPDRNVLVISHGQTLRVLGGLLAGSRSFGGVAIADDAPQGSIVSIEGGRSSIVHLGGGRPSGAA